MNVYFSVDNLFKKILLAVDGSNLTYRSLDYALSLAKKYSAEIMALTVVDIPSNSLLAQGSAFTPISSQNYIDKLINQHKEILEDIAKKVKKINLKTRFSTKLLEGRPADKIVEIAKQESFDLIVIGSRGLGGIKEIFLGSVSDRVADESHCPVLIVKNLSHD